jgi:hypothetical protein
LIRVGNKNDREKREVCNSLGESIAGNVTAAFIECSAKENIRIRVIFDRIMEALAGCKKEAPHVKKQKPQKRKNLQTHDLCCNLMQQIMEAMVT